jgi:hypothetical protein
VAGASKGGRRIDNPPQVNNLPHNSSRRAKNGMDSSTAFRDAELRAGPAAATTAGWRLETPETN